VKTIDAFGIASCAAARDPGCTLGPIVLRNSQTFKKILEQAGISLEWKTFIMPPTENLPPAAVVKVVCDRLDRIVQKQVREGRPFTCLGGDHSSAMGIWGGAMRALEASADLGLIWIDAHMDAHTFATTPSGNIHGMPIAALLGQADVRLRQIYGRRPILSPENVILIGVRSYEPEERDLLDRLRVQVHYMSPDLAGDHLTATLVRCFTRLARSCRHIGISLDLDAIDPRDAPATGIPVPTGLSGAALCHALSQFRGDPRILGLEIAEFKPACDVERRTERLTARLVAALYGERSSP